MSENELDPAANTQQFRAFAQRGQAESVKTPGVNVGLVVALVVALLAVVVVIVAFALL